MVEPGTNQAREDLPYRSAAPSWRTTRILGVDIACLDVAGMLDTVRVWSREERLRTIFYVNAHCLNIAQIDPAYLRLLQSADLVYTDGISVVWAARWLKGKCRLQKMTGADWIEDFCALAEAENLSIYILAGKPGVAGRASEKLIQRYPGLKIAGFSDGYFRVQSEADVLAAIRRLQPDIVLVGRGMPLQEKWIGANRSEISSPVCWAVGALFDYIAGVEPRVPPMLNALALEWFWRFLMNPVGKWRRYLLGNPWFIYNVIKARIIHKQT